MLDVIAVLGMTSQKEALPQAIDSNPIVHSTKQILFLTGPGYSDDTKFRRRYLPREPR
jgi:hypothetical protein